MTDIDKAVARAIEEIDRRDYNANYLPHAKAAIKAHEQALEAEGLVIVPRLPTEAMECAGIDAAPVGRVKYDDGGPVGKSVSYDTDQCAEIYQAMLAALEGK